MDNNVPNSTPLPTTPTPVPPTVKSNTSTIMIVVLLLLVLGAAAVYVLFTVQNKPSITTQIVPTATQKALFLTIDSPKGIVTAVAGEVIVKGKTLPNTTVIAYSDIDEASVDSDTQGDFETTVLVDEEGGLVRVTAYSQNGDETSHTADIQENKEVLGEKTGNENVMRVNKEESRNDLEEKMRNKREEQLTTDKETLRGRKEGQPRPTLTVNEKEAKVKSFLTSVETKRLTKVGVKAIRELQTASSTNSATLTKQQIKKLESTVASTGATLKRHAISGVITSVGEGQITISHQIQTDRVNTIYYNASTAVAIKGIINATTSDLAAGMRIAVVGELVDGILLAKRIHVIPGKAKGVIKKLPVASPSAAISITTTVIPTSLTPTDVIGTLTPTVTPTGVDIATPSLSPTLSTQP